VGLLAAAADDLRTSDDHARPAITLGCDRRVTAVGAPVGIGRAAGIARTWRRSAMRAVAVARHRRTGRSRGTARSHGTAISLAIVRPIRRAIDRPLVASLGRASSNPLGRALGADRLGAGRGLLRTSGLRRLGASGGLGTGRGIRASHGRWFDPGPRLLGAFSAFCLLHAVSEISTGSAISTVRGLRHWFGWCRRAFRRLRRLADSFDALSTPRRGRWLRGR
jgi:hypothetical protein